MIFTPLQVDRHAQQRSFAHASTTGRSNLHASQADNPDSPLLASSRNARQVLQSESLDPLRESLDTFAALEGGSGGGLLDFEAAAAVPEKDLKKYLQASQIDGSLLTNFRQV